MSRVADKRLLVPEEVSRSKFERQIASYRAIEADRRRLGWLVVRAEFPEVVCLFAAAALRPAPILFGVRIGFENYDLWPPSVSFVHPFAEQPLTKQQLAAIPFLRQGPSAPPIELPGGMVVRQPEEILIAHSPNEAPFLCLPGVREYHDHPAHSGDHWFLHRGTAEGTLYFILDTIYRYGVAPIKNYQFGISVVGYGREGIPD